MGTPTLIIVSGPGGSGKTTLAHSLATALGCPAVSRDEIKEGMAASHPGFVPAISDPLTMRTYDVFFEVIALLLRAEVTLVAEAAFQHGLWSRGLEPLLDVCAVRVLRCQLADAVARERALARLTTQPTRAAHTDADYFLAPLSFDAVHLDVPTLDVDTTDGWRPGLTEIADFCRPSRSAEHSAEH